MRLRTALAPFASLLFSLAVTTPAAARLPGSDAGGKAPTTPDAGKKPPKSGEKEEESPVVRGKTPLAEGARLVEAGQLTEAEEILNKLGGGDKPRAQLLLARGQYLRGNYTKARELLAGARSGDEATKLEALLIDAKLLAIAGKRAEAIALLEPKKGVVTGVKPTRAQAPLIAAARALRIQLGELYIDVGKRGDADEPLHAVIDEYEDLDPSDVVGLTDVGRAAHLLRAIRDANQAYSEAEKASQGAGERPPVELLRRRGLLFLEKYDAGHAEEVLRDAKKLAPKRADLLVLEARLVLEQALDFDGANKLLNEAIALNDKLPEIYAIRAGIKLRDMDIAGADGDVAKALSLDPNHLEALSVKAAIRFLDDDLKGYETAKKAVFAKNGEYAEFFVIMNEFAEWEHRYGEIVKMMAEGAKIDPDDGRVLAAWGLTAMRDGDEDGGLAILEQAFKKDKYNIRVYNTLNQYDKVIKRDYDLAKAADGKGMSIRYPKAERALLERYVPQFLGTAWASMKARYDFVPSQPIQVELYSAREHFAVRTSGLPNIGIQGVCFGKTVAAMSPKSEPFNWGNVVWHELGHVFAIQLSKNHVPRWFTEGLSEYETIAKEPSWQRELDPQLYSAIKANRLPGAVDMNQAFTHAESAMDVTVAYYAASQMILFSVEEWGMTGIRKALALWGEGRKTPEVLKLAFGASPEEYDRRFRAWALGRMKRYDAQWLFDERPMPLEKAKAAAEKDPKNARLQADFAFALIAERKLDEGKKALAAALALDPKQREALYLSAKIALGGKKVDEAKTLLAKLVDAGGDGYTARTMLADIAEATKDKAAFRLHSEAAHRWDPDQVEPLQGLYDLATSEKRDDDRVTILRDLVRLDQHDPRPWRNLLSLLVEKKAYGEARKLGEQAVFVAVNDGRVHASYAKALEELGDARGALFEYESAALCENKPEDEARIQDAFAGLLEKQGKKSEAAAHRKEADEARKAVKPAGKPGAEGEDEEDEDDHDHEVPHGPAKPGGEKGREAAKPKGK